MNNTNNNSRSTNRPELVTKDASLWMQHLESEFNSSSLLVEPKHPMGSVSLRLVFMGDFLFLDPLGSGDTEIRNEMYLLNKLLRLEMLTAPQASTLKLEALAQMAGMIEAEAIVITAGFAEDFPVLERPLVINDLSRCFTESKNDAVVRILKMKERRDDENHDDINKVTGGG